MKPPKGWRWVKKGELLKHGDYSGLYFTSVGLEAHADETYIRRITKKRKPTKRKGK